MAKYCDKTGIDQRISTPYVHESNGLIEVTIITDLTRAQAGLVGSKEFGMGTQARCCCKINIIGKREVRAEPVTVWYDRRPDVPHLEVDLMSVSSLAKDAGLSAVYIGHKSYIVDGEGKIKGKVISTGDLVYRQYLHKKTDFAPN